MVNKYLFCMVSFDDKKCFLQLQTSDRLFKKRLSEKDVAPLSLIAYQMKIERIYEFLMFLIIFIKHIFFISVALSSI